MEKIHDNMCKEACSHVFIHENYIKVHVLMYFLQLVLTYFYPPLHHNGKGSNTPLHKFYPWLGKKKLS